LSVEAASETKEIHCFYKHNKTGLSPDNLTKRGFPSKLASNPEVVTERGLPGQVWTLTN